MGVKQDLPLIFGGLIMLLGAAFLVGSSGLPGIGDFDNPIDDIWSSDPDSDSDVYDLNSQFRVSAAALGDVEVGAFTYQTSESSTFLSAVGGLGDFSWTGADDVRVTRVLRNTDTGRVILSDTIQYDSVEGGDEVVVNTDVDNLRSGNYVLDVEVVYDPSWFDVTDVDNTKNREFDINVPKVSN